jgi:hypothetical protein
MKVRYKVALSMVTKSCAWCAGDARLDLPPLPLARRVNSPPTVSFGGKPEVFAQFLRHFAFRDPREHQPHGG